MQFEHLVSIYSELEVYLLLESDGLKINKKKLLRK